MGETGRLKKAAARRRGRTFPISLKFHPKASREEENKWGLMMMFAGAFCLALVAFLSGIWMGKNH